ncbi:unnamed protein product [Staurois parvus]|uniref:Uncharacterized protein n=1 Tax=Staurois parvus TaxID=386267 RepID=A0ABN9EKB6_9NEOB|nr:unnamed protein product [Staurois parvus]
MVGRWQCRGGWPFLKVLRLPCLCVLPGSARHHDPVPVVSGGPSRTLITVRDLCVRS